MDLPPITGTGVLPVTRVHREEPEGSTLAEIESPARLDDDTYSPGGGKASGSDESEDDSEQAEETDGEDSPGDSISVLAKESEGDEINLFA